MTGRPELFNLTSLILSPNPARPATDLKNDKFRVRKAGAKLPDILTNAFGPGSTSIRATISWPPAFVKKCKICTATAKIRYDGRDSVDIGFSLEIDWLFLYQTLIENKNKMSLIKIVMYALIFVLGLLFLGRFFF